jgi:hydroxyethylthiazole kinase
MTDSIDIKGIHARITQQKPLIHHITNWVTIYDCANITRCFGALPVMAHAREEVAEMAAVAGALVLNIGTLTNELIESMIIAGAAANKKGIPVVLDAVGVGATGMRTQKTLELLDRLEINILKGNYGEIGVLAGANAKVKGVESISLDGQPDEIAGTLARKLGNTVVMTGETDIISDGQTSYSVGNGDEMMGSIVGTGCMASSVIASFAAVEKNQLNASTAALAAYGIAGELAAKNPCGPGTYKERFYDMAYGLRDADLNGMAKIKG